ncbi:FxLD family lanthipeptide [Nocardiopsis sp. NPDC049922]|uniref:FxLD family lanthipeptide n=1 Tax=Nocardiopsis sp. NPDC049922 TaxID=3155157 RepID=UPI0034053FFF
MSTPTIEQPTQPQDTTDTSTEVTDPFGLDISFIEGTPMTESILACSTGDTCGSSCPSACTTS